MVQDLSPIRAIQVLEDQVGVFPIFQLFLIWMVVPRCGEDLLGDLRNCEVSNF